MLKNSRELFDRFLGELVPAGGFWLAKARPGDFAIYELGGQAAKLAVLQVARASGVRRFVGHVGVIGGDSIETDGRGRMLIDGIRLTHIFNVEGLLATAYIDENDVRGSIEEFLVAIRQEFDRLEYGSFERDLDPFGEQLILTPVAGAPLRSN